MSEAPETQISQPLIMPPEVSAGMAWAQAVAADRQGVATITRRIPETEGWLVAVSVSPTRLEVYRRGPGDEPLLIGVPTTVREAEMLLEEVAAGANPTPLGAPEPPPPPAGPELAAIRARAIARVNADAERARLAHITAGSGQAMVYQAKQAEAERVVALAIAEPDGTSPFLEAELAIYGGLVDLQGLAQIILNTADQWRSIAAQIETLRLGAGMAIAAAETEAEIMAATNISWP